MSTVLTCPVCERVQMMDYLNDKTISVRKGMLYETIKENVKWVNCDTCAFHYYLDKNGVRHQHSQLQDYLRKLESERNIFDGQ